MRASGILEEKGYSATFAKVMVACMEALMRKCASCSPSCSRRQASFKANTNASVLAKRANARRRASGQRPVVVHTPYLRLLLQLRSPVRL